MRNRYTVILELESRFPRARAPLSNGRAAQSVAPGQDAGQSFELREVGSNSGTMHVSAGKTIFDHRKRPYGDGLSSSGIDATYLTCLPIRPAISNIDTCGLPKTARSLVSALIMRLFVLS